MRIPRVAALVAVVGVIASGCADSLPGTAARIGGETITVDTLQAEVDAVVDYRSGEGRVEGAPGVRTELGQVTRQVLSQDVLHELVDEAVRSPGFTVDEAAIETQLAAVDQEALLAQPGQTFLTPDSVGDLVRDQLIVAQLGREAWDGLSVTIDLVQGTDRGDAEALARRMALGDVEAEAVLAELGDRAQSGLAVSPANTQPPLLGTPLFSTPEGSATAFGLSGQEGQPEQWFAVRVVERSTDATPVTDENVVGAEQAELADTLSLGRALLNGAAGEPEVRLNPRYGQWDPTTSQVIDTSDVPSAVVVRG